MRESSPVALCVPWRYSPVRGALFDKVQDWYLQNFSVPMFARDSTGPVFSRAQAINRAVRAAEAVDARVVIINDADTLPSQASLVKAVGLTLRDGKPRLPYDRYYLMDAQKTKDYLDVGLLPTRGVYEGAVSGCLVVDVNHFWEVGGFDEDYVGWGHEDSDFAARIQFERIPGSVYSLWHPQAPRDAYAELNAKRYQERWGDELESEPASRVDGQPGPS